MSSIFNEYETSAHTWNTIRYTCADKHDIGKRSITYQSIISLIAPLSQQTNARDSDMTQSSIPSRGPWKRICCPEEEEEKARLQIRLRHA